MRSAADPFWRALSDRGDAIAIVDTGAGEVWTYRRLGDRVRAVSSVLESSARSLLLLFARNDIGSVIIYLAALEAGLAICLWPDGIEYSAASALIDEYQPQLIAAPCDRAATLQQCGYAPVGEESGFEIVIRRSFTGEPTNEALSLLLTTSASSGSRKCVRISAAGVAASAAQVVAALNITETDRSLLGLPISYVYGLSVLNSTLCAGASIALVGGTPADSAYWEAVSRSRPTMIPAVSQTLEYLRWLHMDAARLPSLRGLTHSGEALDPRLRQWTYEQFGRRGVSVYLMYGQTEACGRIAVLPPERVGDKHGSVGIAIPGGAISIGSASEIVYTGPGVMLGYATRREDLAVGDTLYGVLNTGDIGYLDEHGCLYITGRLTRYCKVFGRRISLDEIEATIRTHCAAAVVEKHGSIVVFLERAVSSYCPPIAALARQFALPPQSFRLQVLEAFPRAERGKISYSALVEQA